MKKFLTILTFLFITLIINATEYYVATPANGGKDTNTGLIGFPFATINYASLHVPAGTNTIHIGAGVFNEGINRMKFAEGVSIVGAGIIPPVTQVISNYVGDSLTLGSFVFTSPAQGTNGNQSVSNIWFDGSSITANLAILVERRSNVSIFNCKFTNFKYSAITMIGGADRMTEPITYATGNQIYNDTINNCTGYYGTNSRGAIEIVGQSGIKIYYNRFDQRQRVVGNETLIQGVSTFNKLIDVHDNYVNKLILSNAVTPTDFHIQATSPAISAGNPTAGEMTTDAGGNPIKNPPVIGAYEYYAVVPTVSTVAATNISNTTATSGRLFVADGGSNIAMSGVCWNKNGNPTITDSHTNDGVISPYGVPNIISNITGLVQGTLYHVRAYATNATGIGYGNDLTFTTSGTGIVVIPTVNTTTVTNIAQTTATSGGNITSNGGATVTTGGVCWSTAINPTISNSKTIDGITTNGDFVSNITGLTPNTPYHVRAYATNSAGTAYGSDLIFTTLGIPVVLPTVTTTVIINIAQTTAIGGGNVTSDGGATVTVRGVCWDMSGGPGIDNVHTTDGTGTGIFTSSITGLNPNTTYYVVAYATNSVGTAYGARVQFNTLLNPVLPTVTTTAITAITQTTATSGGNVTSDGGTTVTTRGICWATTPNPIIANSNTSNGTGTGIFTSSITGLLANTLYYVRAYATNSVGTTYGASVQFTTLPIPAVLSTVTTTVITSITQTTAISGGNVTSDGGATVTLKGVCWATTPNPIIANSNTSNGTGTGIYVSSLTNLIANTTYHVRSYATNSVGTSYGNDISFITLPIPAVLSTVTTTVITNIAQTTVTGGGNVTSDGGATVTARGVCWSTTSNPTIVNSLTNDGNGIGTYVSSLIGLIANTTYHLRAYATNSVGASYGNDILFITLPIPIVVPTVTTTILTAVTQTTAILGGNVTSDGGATVTARGVCWAITANPTTANSLTNDGTGTGIYVSSLTNLNLNTTYHVRSYATNSVGTSYGNEVLFTTLNNAALATVTTTPVTNVVKTTTTSGGNVISDGGGNVIQRGVCWATTANPTIINTRTFDSYGTGLYVSNMTGLTKSTNYYVRAYATNSAGTAYGVDITFKTDDVPTVITTGIINKLQTSVTSGGNVTNDDSFAVTARGVCWAKTINPTVDSLHTVDGAGLGKYVSQITGLTPNTRYHVRAYATNVGGTAYGNDITVTTPDYLTEKK